MIKTLRATAIILAMWASVAAPASAQMRSGNEWQERVAADIRTYKIHGAIAGFVLGAGVTAIVVNSGGSTSLCDRSANQDAINSTECAGLIAAGGLVGGIAGYFIGARIQRDVRLEVLPRVSPRGSYFMIGLRDAGALIRAVAPRPRPLECARSICDSAASAF
jgi:hypothetical protein